MDVTTNVERLDCMNGSEGGPRPTLRRTTRRRETMRKRGLVGRSRWTDLRKYPEDPLDRIASCGRDARTTMAAARAISVEARNRNS